MITRGTRLRLVVFLAVAAVGTTVVGVQYVGLDRTLWNRPYTVTVAMDSTGGIFENAEVTYRGVAVGRVADLRLVDDGVAVDLALEKGVRVPADVVAVVANRSAIGEQFVDLQPRNNAAPWLKDGSIIKEEDTRVPPRIENVLLEVDELAASVDQESLRVLVSELGTAFGGLGPELRSTLDHTDSLVRNLSDAFPETRTLLAEGRTVLATQRDTSQELAKWSKDVNLLSRSVARADTSVRTLLDETARTAPALSRLVADNDQQLPLLLRDLVTVGDIVRARLPGIRVFLVAFPRLIQDTFNVVQGDGYVHFNLILDYSSGVCTSKGFSDTKKAPQAKPVKQLGNPARRANINGYCAEPRGSITAARGSQNVPKLPGDTYDPATKKVPNPRRGRLGPDDIPPTSYEREADPASSRRSTTSRQSQSQAAPRPAVVDPRTGVVSDANGPLLVLGGDGGQQARFGDEAWKWLLMAPILQGRT